MLPSVSSLMHPQQEHQSHDSLSLPPPPRPPSQSSTQSPLHQMPQSYTMGGHGRPGFGDGKRLPRIQVPEYSMLSTPISTPNPDQFGCGRHGSSPPPLPPSASLPNNADEESGGFHGAACGPGKYINGGGCSFEGSNNGMLLQSTKFTNKSSNMTLPATPLQTPQTSTSSSWANIERRSGGPGDLQQGITHSAESTPVNGRSGSNGGGSARPGEMGRVQLPSLKSLGDGLMRPSSASNTSLPPLILPGRGSNGVNDLPLRSHSFSGRSSGSGAVSPGGAPRQGTLLPPLGAVSESPEQLQSPFQSQNNSPSRFPPPPQLHHRGSIHGGGNNYTHVAPPPRPISPRSGGGSVGSAYGIATPHTPSRGSFSGQGYGYRGRHYSYGGSREDEGSGYFGEASGGSCIDGSNSSMVSPMAGPPPPSSGPAHFAQPSPSRYGPSPSGRLPQLPPPPPPQPASQQGYVAGHGPVPPQTPKLGQYNGPFYGPSTPPPPPSHVQQSPHTPGSYGGGFAPHAPHTPHTPQHQIVGGPCSGGPGVSAYEATPRGLGLGIFAPAGGVAGAPVQAYPGAGPLGGPGMGHAMGGSTGEVCGGHQLVGGAPPVYHQQHAHHHHHHQQQQHHAGPSGHVGAQFKATPMLELTASREIKRRTKTGCLTCRKRRIKCDERFPTCFNCDKSKRVCLSYDPIFKLNQDRRRRRSSGWLKQQLTCKNEDENREIVTEEDMDQDKVVGKREEEEEKKEQERRAMISSPPRRANKMDISSLLDAAAVLETGGSAMSRGPSSCSSSCGSSISSSSGSERKRSLSNPDGGFAMKAFGKRQKREEGRGGADVGAWFETGPCRSWEVVERLFADHFAGHLDAVFGGGRFSGIKVLNLARSAGLPLDGSETMTIPGSNSSSRGNAAYCAGAGAGLSFSGRNGTAAATGGPGGGGPMDAESAAAMAAAVAAATASSNCTVRIGQALAVLEAVRQVLGATCPGVDVEGLRVDEGTVGKLEELRISNDYKALRAVCQLAFNLRDGAGDKEGAGGRRRRGNGGSGRFLSVGEGDERILYKVQLLDRVSRMAVAEEEAEGGVEEGEAEEAGDEEERAEGRGRVRRRGREGRVEDEVCCILDGVKRGEGVGALEAWVVLGYIASRESRGRLDVIGERELCAIAGLAGRAAAAGGGVAELLLLIGALYFVKREGASGRAAGEVDGGVRHARERWSGQVLLARVVERMLEGDLK